MNTTDPRPSPPERFPAPPRRRAGVGLRLFIMALILLPLWIFSLAVNGVVSEREGVREQAQQEISAKWGDAQTLAGPVLVLPWDEVERTSVVENGKTSVKTKWHRRTATLLPDEFTVEGELTPELRKRGIFETVLYIASLTVRGRFPALNRTGLGIADANLRTGEAVLSVGVSDPRGIREAVTLGWDGASLPFQPGPGSDAVFDKGFHVRGLKLPTRGNALPFAFKLSLNGSRSFQVAPVGRETKVALHSSWPDPSFSGEYLPVDREVTAAGFKASWKVQQLARSFPQAWLDQQVTAASLNGAGFGVGLIKTASAYQQTSRATKYALLFIVLTFTFFFLVEIKGGLRVHPLQYLLVGAALVVFYLLLLSVSELTGFGWAYALATLATLGLVGSYVRAVLKEKARAAALSACLAGLYIYLYVVLQLEDFALLMGSLGVFVALGAVMLLTRKIDWYAVETAEKQ